MEFAFVLLHIFMIDLKCISNASYPFASAKFCGESDSALGKKNWQSLTKSEWKIKEKVKELFERVDKGGRRLWEYLHIYKGINILEIYYE